MLCFVILDLQGQEDSSRGSDNSSYDETLSPTSPGPLSVRSSHGERDLVNSSMTQPISDLHGINPVFLSSNPSRWSVEEVYEFIASLQGKSISFLPCPEEEEWGKWLYIGHLNIGMNKMLVDLK